MLYTIEGATEFAIRAHDGQVDKQGLPYILHPLRVGASLWRFGSEYVIAGLLHDVVEDTHHTLDDLRALGASESVIAAVDAVTKTESERTVEAYERSIRKAMEDPIGLWVKAADVSDNASRVDDIRDPELRHRLRVKYAMASKVLGSRIPRFAPGKPLAPLGWGERGRPLWDVLPD